ncbi:MAG: hypothetical protein N839_0006585 [Desulfofustis sp. PB-SRB1]|jgi:hypothetical protein|nr:hypothetical protein [Desulfofustis sp. PB-SRB1]MBM1002067.1 hypothetical protein [Desulfofustis sp. PB-SRB1]HBH30207.1 hypothetical protein [Desulfofustis sp.]HBH30704.1 hypothetical protein [Desulfofustis sp.]
MLKQEGLIDDSFITMIMKWRYSSGFSVHNEVRIAPDDAKAIENLSQYSIRNSYSLEKLKYEAGDLSVIVAYEDEWPGSDEPMFGWQKICRPPPDRCAHIWWEMGLHGGFGRAIHWRNQAGLKNSLKRRQKRAKLLSHTARG